MNPMTQALFRGMEGEAQHWGSEMAAHMPTLYLLAKNATGPIVECGVGKGFSTVALVAGAMEGRHKVVSYDLEPACRRLALEHMGLESSDESIVNAFWEFRHKGSVEAACDFHDQEVGLWFLDTTHATEDTLRELSAWLPKMRGDGIMCGHDYFIHEHPDFPHKTGVKHAVDPFVEQHKDRFRLQVMKYDQGLFVLWPK